MSKTGCNMVRALSWDVRGQGKNNGLNWKFFQSHLSICEPAMSFSFCSLA